MNSFKYPRLLGGSAVVAARAGAAAPRWIALLLAAALGLACASPAPPASAPAAPASGAAAPAPAATTPSGGAASAPAPERLKIIYSSLAGNYMPLWIAVDSGLFREQGLDAELLLIESGTAATQ